ncbi:hypothetical protein EDD37DRAFT_604759 [Exophiala viscosa]|uniref:uncharacterized protein n=1 Tax=Exophiala viscosa TaxID=2486360 RepID=UPI00219D4C5C|nr:hypothetical protein EDD37DRAFT_604759 [Exophiala viscosa]
MAASAPGDGLSDIDSEGDLMLKVGGELGGQHGHTGSNGNGNAYPYRLLRVSSKIMMSASPMFKTMLKAERFLEGSLALSIEQPPQLDLPEDEPEAFTTLCRIIHHKQGLQDPTLFKSLHGLAILSDKYDCLNNIKPWFTFCLNQKLLQFRAINMEDLPHLISAAYLFDDPTAFYGLTMTAVRFLPRCIRLATFKEGLFPSIAEKLAGTLETIRQTRLKDLISRFQEATRTLFVDNNSVENTRDWNTRISIYDVDQTQRGIYGPCKGQACRVGNLIWALVRARLWTHRGLPNYSLVYAFDFARCIAQTIDLFETKVEDTGVKLELCEEGSCDSCERDWENMLQNLVEGCEKEVAGICLVCFKKDSLEVTEPTQKCKDHCNTYPASTWTMDMTGWPQKGD